MHDDIMEEELNCAHKSGMAVLSESSDEDLIHHSDGKIYRTAIKNGKGKTKLICNALVKLTDIKNMGTDDKPAYEYQFSVQGQHCKAPTLNYFKPKNLTSNRTFTSKLMGMIPFGEFSGNKHDFSEFFMKEVDTYLAKSNGT